MPPQAKPQAEPSKVLELEALAGANTAEAFYSGVLAWADTLGLVPPGTLESLGKRVEAHPAHYAPRTREGRFRTRTAATTQIRAGTGRFVLPLPPADRALAVHRAGLLVDNQLDPRIQDHLFDYEAGRMSSGEWERRTIRDIKHFYEELYRCGMQAAGNPAARLRPHDKALLNRLVKDEGDFLRGFREHLDQGKGKMPYHDRARLYAQAAWEAFWNGWTLGDQRSGREIRWRYGPTEEHCRDCARFVAMGWTPVAVFVSQVLTKGFAPRSGQLECQGHQCKCFLQDRLNGVEGPAFSYPG